MIVDLVTGRWVDRQADLDDAHRCAGRPSPGTRIDTEFHREKTYFPRLALVQLAWPGDLVLVDPLAVDAAPLRRLFETPALAVAHAAQQDLDVLTHAVGAVPAAPVRHPGRRRLRRLRHAVAVSLLQGELGITPAKGDRLTDWLRRPLPTRRRYAAADVASLLELHDRLVAELELGRLGWVEEACEELRTRPTGAIDPEGWLS